MGLPRRARWPAAVGLLAASLAGAGAALVACSSGTQTGYLPGSGGGPLGAPSGGDDASAGSPAPTPSSPAGQGDDASGAAPDAGSSAAGEGGASDGATDGGAGEGGGGGDGATPAITFTLLDTTVTTAVQGTPVPGYDPIPAGATISLAAVGTSLSIRANTTTATVGSVEFILDANYTHTENATPYTLCGDNGQGTVTACTLQLLPGQHILIGTEFTAANLGGTNEGTATLDFTITP